jgi:arabinose-5-phosphate isomerase
MTSERKNILDAGKRVLSIESKAIARLVEQLDESFVRAVELISQCTGRVIVTGIGKSGMVAKKIAATLTSTGTSAIFLHPAEGVHGDLGMVLKHDLVICISKSGNTDEITRLFPVFKQIGVPIITLTGNIRSALAARSDVVLDVSVTEEACPNDLAPTASTTTAMAMGDALAVALLEKRHFKAKDFAFLHPGGSLGRMLLNVDDIMFSGDKLPLVKADSPFREIVLEITKKRFGGTCVVDDEHRLIGIITDGDLRRHWQKPGSTDELFAKDILNPNPKTIPSGYLSIEALRLMEHYNILQLIVVDHDQHPIGMIHIHDLLEAGMERREYEAPEKAY